MRFGKPGIDLNGIAELDDGLLKLILFDVLCAAVQVLELLFIGIG